MHGSKHNANLLARRSQPHPRGRALVRRVRMCAGGPPARSRRADAMTRDLNARALRLSYFTVGYNMVEGVASVLAGGAAGSVALVGFGLDSFVESLSGVVMIWRFRDGGHQAVEFREVDARHGRRGPRPATGPVVGRAKKSASPVWSARRAFQLGSGVS